MIWFLRNDKAYGSIKCLFCYPKHLYKFQRISFIKKKENCTAGNIVIDTILVSKEKVFNNIVFLSEILGYCSWNIILSAY